MFACEVLLADLHLEHEKPDIEQMTRGCSTLLRLYGSPSKVEVLFQSSSVYSFPFTGGSVNLPLRTAAARLQAVTSYKFQNAAARAAKYGSKPTCYTGCDYNPFDASLASRVQYVGSAIDGRIDQVFLRFARFGEKR